MRSLRGCRGALAAEATTEEGDAELQDGAERLKRGLSIPAGSLRAEPLNLRRPTLDAKREYNNNCEKKTKQCTKSCVCEGVEGVGVGFGTIMLGAPGLLADGAPGGSFGTAVRLLVPPLARGGVGAAQRARRE